MENDWSDFMLTKLRLSLPVKIFLVALLNLLLISLVLFVFFRVQYRFDLQSFLITPSHDRILSVARQIALELPDTRRATWGEILSRYSAPNKVNLWLTDDDGMQLAGGPTVIPQTVTEKLERQFHQHDRDNPLLLLGTTQAPSKHWIGVRIPIPSETGGHHDHGVLVAAASSLIGTPFFFDPKPWIAVVLAAIGISFLCWLPFVKSLTRSVSYMNRATSEIAEGQFKIQLPVTRSDELGQLSSSINRLATRLDGFVVGQKRFLGDTAHELCSPIARMQVATGILERSSDAAVTTILPDLKDDLQQLSTLVDNVLSYSKAGLRGPGVKLSSVALSVAVDTVLEREVVNADQVTVRVPSNLYVSADKDLLERALSNLVRNAIRYATTAGLIEITASSNSSGVFLRVADSGPGIPEQHLNRIFDPFYRPEFARDRNTGGVGLGLAIVKSCIEACNGTVTCRNRSGKGFEVEMRFNSAVASSELADRS